MMHGEWDTKPGYTELAEDLKLECGPMPNVMAALPNIGGALCSTPQRIWLTPTTGVLCSTSIAVKLAERKFWTQSELCTWQNSATRQEPPKMYI